MIKTTPCWRLIENSNLQKVEFDSVMNEDNKYKNKYILPVHTLHFSPQSNSNTNIMDPLSVGSFIQNHDDWNVFGACDHFHLNGAGLLMIGENMVATCQWKEGRLNGEFVLTRDDTLIGVYELRDSIVVSSKCLDNCAFDIVDLSDEGNRWEGIALDRKPCGYGEYYNSEGILTYKGFMIDDKCMCCGILYFEDIGTVSYVGTFYKGQRWGKGIQYDRQGHIVYNGIWIADKQAPPILYVKRSNQLSSVHTQLERITIDIIHGDVKPTCIISSYFGHLEYLTFGSSSLLSVTDLQIDNLASLKSLKFGENSFNSWSLSYSNGTSNRSDESGNRRLWIHHCPKLQSITFGRTSFYPANTFQIERENRCNL